MKQHARTVVMLTLASAALSGCGPHLAKLGVCSTGPFRYANAKGVSLPSLSVPTPEDLSSPTSSPPGAGAGPNTAPPPPVPAPGAAVPPPPPADSKAPVASPPKRGAMVVPRDASPFGSC